ncbi:MAG TPA: hypothetical protein VGF67_09420 [Ktedonobacteraceae bacterium]
MRERGMDAQSVVAHAKSVAVPRNWLPMARQRVPHANALCLPEHGQIGQRLRYQRVLPTRLLFPQSQRSLAENFGLFVPALRPVSETARSGRSEGSLLKQVKSPCIPAPGTGAPGSAGDRRPADAAGASRLCFR